MTDKYDYDVLYIGAGHATFDGAAPLAKTGVRVGVIESGLDWGHLPQSWLQRQDHPWWTCQINAEATRLNDILSSAPTINWTANVAHKQEIIDPLPAGLTARLEDGGATIIHGHATFKDAHTVVVDDQQTITAEKIVIATGLKPHRLDIPGTKLAHDSSDFMNLKTVTTKYRHHWRRLYWYGIATIANAAGAQGQSCYMATRPPWFLPTIRCTSGWRLNRTWGNLHQKCQRASIYQTGWPVPS